MSTKESQIVDPAAFMEATINVLLREGKTDLLGHIYNAARKQMRNERYAAMAQERTDVLLGCSRHERQASAPNDVS
jgi:hypothetical protein